MNNLEEIDGFFAALICSPDVAKPSEYLLEIWGREMADDEAFSDRQELRDFLSLLFSTLEQHCPQESKLRAQSRPMGRRK
jgi:yecA family protein